MSDSPFTPGQYQAAAETVQPPPVGATLPDDAAQQVAGSASATEVDVPALLAQMQAQQAAMAEEIARLRAGQGPQGDHPLVGVAQQAREQLALHFSHDDTTRNPENVMRLADDLVDAAGNAVESGDPSAARNVGEKLLRALAKVNPGPGDHHYYAQALGFVRDHFPDAADTITEARPSSAPAVSGGAPAKVVAGSVTG